ncbi:MAG: response regulator [Pyrinomonadaceae bacterium]
MIVHDAEHFSDVSTEQQSVVGEAQPTKLTRLDGVRVLIVDDERDTRGLLVTILTQSGARVQAAATVADALEMLRLKKQDLLISDIEMPNEDGYSLIRKVRVLEEGQGGRIPAIALTAHARASDRLRALSAGYQLHMPKPVEPAELVMAIANLTNRGQSPSSETAPNKSFDRTRN